VNAATAPLAAGLVLAAVYALRGGAGEADPTARFWSRRRWISAAAGISVAYVFVDVLPELAERGATLTQLGGAALFGEQRIYLLTLLAFVVMYGLEYIVLTAERRGESRSAERPPDAAYWIQLAGYAAYSALIGYLLTERAERGALALVLYAVAMGLHFLIVNHSLAEAHGAPYRRQGHWWLAASVVAGAVAGVAIPISEVAVARLFALLAGGVVITSLRAELPDHETGRFLPFCLGAVGYALLLVNA